MMRIKRTEHETHFHYLDRVTTTLYVYNALPAGVVDRSVAHDRQELLQAPRPRRPAARVQRRQPPPARAGPAAVHQDDGSDDQQPRRHHLPHPHRHRAAGELGHYAGRRDTGHRSTGNQCSGTGTFGFINAFLIIVNVGVFDLEIVIMLVDGTQATVVQEINGQVRERLALLIQ